MSGRVRKTTTSASCSIEPLSRRSLSIGDGGCRFSIARESCDSASTGTRSSRAISFSVRETMLISATRFVSIGARLQACTSWMWSTMISPSPPAPPARAARSSSSLCRFRDFERISANVCPAVSSM